jgi:Family of unknown function (DUF6266)
MAILYNGINGPFSGKVGTVVGYKWKNKAVMRGLPSQRKGGPSPLQLQQHAKFRLMNAFLNPLVSLLNLTFNNLAFQMTGYNKAFSYNVKNAIAGVYPEYNIDYPMVLISRGDLPNVTTPSVTSSETGILKFSWTDNSGKGKAKPTDMAFVAIFNEEKKQWINKLNLSMRSSGNCSIDVSKLFAKQVHSYIGFISEDGKEVTDSVYIGLVNL